MRRIVLVGIAVVGCFRPDPQRAPSAPSNHVHPQTRRFEGVPPGIVAHGSVVDEQGDPIEGARVELCASIVDPAGTINAPITLCEESLARVETDPDGEVEISWRLSDQKRALARPVAIAMVIAADGYTAVVLQGSELLDTTARVDAAIVLSRAPDIRARLMTSASISYPIEVGWFRDLPGGLQVRHAFYTGNPGTPRFDLVPPGTITFYAFDRSTRRYGLSTQTISPAQTTTIPLALDQPLLAIRGSIVDRHGQPLSFVEVAATPLDGTTQTMFDRALRDVQSAYPRVDLDGTFDVLVHGTGRYRVQFSSKTCEHCGGGLQPIADLVASASTSGSLYTVAPGGSADVVRCRLVDATGTPISIQHASISCIEPTVHPEGGHSGGEFSSTNRTGAVVHSLSFVWPGGAQRIGVSFLGSAGQRGSIQLTDAASPCVATQVASP
ncbi:MAG: hypothetical protein AB7P03_17415 [Kofleriaceae bacterium]